MKQNNLNICLDNAYNYTVQCKYNTCAKEVLKMAQTNITIRLDDDVKKDAEMLFSKLGLNMSAAVNVFFRQAVQEQAIPFQIKLVDNYFNENNMKHINESIQQLKAGNVVMKSMAELEAMADE